MTTNDENELYRILRLSLKSTDTWTLSLPLDYERKKPEWEKTFSTSDINQVIHVLRKAVQDELSSRIDSLNTSEVKGA